jgi:hypothetical protein
MSWYNDKTGNFNRTIHIQGSENVRAFTDYMKIMEANEYDWKVFVVPGSLKTYPWKSDVHTIVVEYVEEKDWTNFCRMVKPKFKIKNANNRGYIGY